MKKNWKDKIQDKLRIKGHRERRSGNKRSAIGQYVPLLGLLLFFLLWGCSGPDHDHQSGQEENYTCPMHPEVVQEGPGTCPVCGMDLVPLHASGDTTAVAAGLEFLLQPVNHTIVADIRTVVPVKRPGDGFDEAYGRIMYDTRRAYTIPVRFSGRIEKLNVNYNFEPVRKGQKILELYSPEIVTAQKELLYLLESDPGNSHLIAASKQKLRLLGLSSAQIVRLAETGTASYSLPVYSPYNGYIYEESAAPALQNQAQNEAGTGGSTAPMAARSRLAMREGMYLNKGETAFKVINTDKVWAEFSLYPQAAPYVRQGDAVTILPDYNKDLKIETEVDFVQPYYQNGESFSKVRVYLPNSQHRFMPGQLVTARLASRVDSTLWVPATSVVDLGTRKVVFIKEGEAFHPAGISTGRASEGWTQVVSGLSARDSVAYNGHFMVDSEGFIKLKRERR